MEIFNKLRVLDGGMGHLLMKKGFPISDDPLWSARLLITNPDAIVSAHKEFLNAEATVIETCSYQACLPTLQKTLKLSWAQSADVVKTSVRLAKRAVEEFRRENNGFDQSTEIYIAGSIGSYGTNLSDKSEYTGAYIDFTPTETITEYYKQQAELLLEAGVDLLAFETVPASKEAEIICQVLKSLPPTTNWISFYCKDETSTGHGEDFSDVAKKLSKESCVSAMGINCTKPQHVNELLQKTSLETRKPLVIYPNSENDEPFIDYIPNWVKFGAKIIGGCCGVEPKRAKDIADTLKAMS